MKRITYLLGAGASANAIPVVAGLNDRFKFFLEFIKNAKNGIPGDILNEFADITFKLESHYSPDTYAKKLFLQNPDIHTNSEYNQFKNYLTAYLLFEQTAKNISDIENPFNARGRGLYLSENKKHINQIVSDLDYRYDAFWATILQNDGTGIKIPNEINIVSWNYDIQVEKSYMNFTGTTLDDAVENLNVVGLNREMPVINVDASKIVKLNGSALLFKNQKFNELFDFKNHALDQDSVEIIFKSLIQKTTEYKNCLRFAWENDNISKQARDKARNLLKASDIIIIIGYSFPYFNRDIDQFLFQDVTTGHGMKQVYLQVPQKDYDSVAFRLRSIRREIVLNPFYQTDQFYIPF